MLIIDDEPPARRGIAIRLKRHPDVEVVGESGDGVEALKDILSLAPDLVFLDVQMPGMNGFDVLRALPEDKVPHVIFLTAFEEYALRAFEVHALDYLLKPIDDRRFRAMMEYVRRRLHSAASPVPDQRIKALLHRPLLFSDASFAIRTGLRTRIVSHEDVLWISAAGDYVELHAKLGAVHLLRETMTALEERLDPAKFIRIHRSRIVRRDQIAEVLSEDDGEYVIKLRDGSEHRCSRTYSRMLTGWLQSGKA
ncbi:MAG TPA: LytTR family DNA-binding domain-containing protein [Candidatus Acidoferrum sp.]|nr:LytTR family DNA-binding domain-containing protein [Candidatus Acidoferrum sp.]